MQTSTNTMNISIPTSTIVDIVDRFLKLELAAAATYEQAIDHIDDPATREVLTRNRTSHASRAVALAQHIKKEGRTPSETSGPLSFFTKLVEGGASLLGRGAVLKALHEGEQYLLQTFLADMPRIQSSRYRELWASVLAEQHECERRTGALVA